MGARGDSRSLALAFCSHTDTMVRLTVQLNRGADTQTEAELTLTGRAGPVKSTIACERVALGKHSKIIKLMGLWGKDRGKERGTRYEF